MHPFDGKTKHFFISVFQKGKVQIPFDAAKPSSSQALDRNFPQRGFPSTARPSNLHPPSYVRDGSQGGISSFGRSVHKFDLKKKLVREFGRPPFESDIDGTREGVMGSSVLSLSRSDPNYKSVLSDPGLPFSGHTRPFPVETLVTLSTFSPLSLLRD